MMRTLILLLSVLFFSQNMLAQNVGIGTDNPHPSAILDLVASDKGLLIPRITTSARNTLAATAVEGLLVYDTDIKLFYYFKNGVWTPLTNGNGGGNWSLNGNNIFKNNSGNVGIGTSVPYYPLDFGYSTGKKLALYQNGNGQDFYGFGIGGGTLEFYTGAPDTISPPLMVLNSAQNVGIGTSLPKEKLEVAGNLQLTNGTNRTIGLASDNGRQLTAGQRDLTIKAGGRISSSDATSVGGNLILKAGSANIGSNPVPKSNDVLIYAGDNVRVGNNGNLYNGDIAFFAGDGLPERMRIVGNTGNIGIRNSTPHYPLDFGFSTGKKLALYQNGNGEDFYGLGIGGGTLEFYASSSKTSDVPSMVINQAQNVGIGTTTPTERLTVEGTAKATKFLGKSANLERGIFLESEDGNTKYGFISSSMNSDDMFFSNYKGGHIFLARNGSGGRVHISGKGNVGIGKTNPTKKLEVVGSENESHVMRIENKSDHNKADGLEIKINSTTNYENDFIIFSDANGVQGRIEGKTNLIDINGTDAFSIVMKNLLVFPSLDEPTVTNPNGHITPGIDPFIAFNFTGFLTDVEMNTELREADLDRANRYGEVESLFGVGIQEDFAVEMILQGIDLLNAIISAGTSLLSVADPEDIFSEAVNLVATIAQIAIYAKYTAGNNGIALQTGAGDYAEWLEKDDLKEFFSHGDIVGVRAGVISKSFIEADHYMAISTSPAVAGKLPQPDEEHKYEMAAFMGQIPVKVRGIVNKGDYILPSGDGDGLGIAVHPDKMLAKDYHRIVGIAWEASDGKELFKMINTAVGINKNDLAGMVDQMQQLLNEMQLALKEVNPNYELSLYQTDDKSYKASSTPLDYTVSPTHHTKATQYFANKDFSTQKETLQAVKEALVNLGGIDLSEQPLLVHMLDHPEQAGELVTYYSNILNQFNAFLEASTVDGGN